MNELHQPWTWRLAPGSALRLAAAPVARWLAVGEGRVWLTRSGAGPEGEDIWLEPGQRHPLPAGTDWVAEGWPEARIELLQAPVSVRAASQARRRVWPPALRAA